MSYVKIWLHCIWSTKHRENTIDNSLRPTLLAHFREYAQSKLIALDYINAHHDHVHALINLQKAQNIATVMKLLKGESAYWVNKMQLVKQQFAWQDEYFAASVSQSHVDKVRTYIRNQDEHHQKTTWEQERHLLIDRYGFEEIKDKSHFRGRV